MLHSWLAWLEHDHTPDLVSSWHLPCTRRDCNLLLGLYSSPGYPTREAVPLKEGLRGRDFESGFKRVELDIRSYRFLVKHLGKAQGEAVPVPLRPAL